MTIPYPTSNSIRWRYRCWIDGIEYAVVETPRRKFSLDNQTGSCTIETATIPPESAAGANAFVDATARDESGAAHTFRFFTGTYRHDLSQGGPQSNRGTIVDASARLDNAPVSDITWNNRSFPAAVRDVLTAAGLTAAEIGGIFDPGAIYNLGDVETIAIESGEANLEDVFRDLMKHGGTSYYVDPNGVLQVVVNIILPASTSAFVYASGRQTDGTVGTLPTGTRGMSAPANQYQSQRNPLRSYTARGPRLESGAEPNSTYTLDASIAPQGRNDEGVYQYAQTNAVCEAIAKREVRRNSMTARKTRIRTDQRNDELPGVTIGVYAPEIGIEGGGPTTGANAIIWSMANSDELNNLDVYIAASLAAGDSTSEPGEDDNGEGDGEPTATFSIEIDEEQDASGNTIYVVQVDASESASPGGTGLTYSWDFDPDSGGNADPTTGTDAIMACVYTTESLEGESIELTIDDGTNTTTITRALDADDIEPFTRVLTAAVDGDWRIMATPGEWATYEVTDYGCQAVPRYNETGYLYSAWWDETTEDDDLRVYRLPPDEIYDGTPELVHTVTDGGKPTCIYVTETFDDTSANNVVYVAHGTSLTYSRNAQADTTSWTTITGVASTIINSVAVDPFNTQHVTACADNELIESYDGGTTWEALITNADAGTPAAEDFAAAPWGTAAVFSGVSDQANAVLFVEAGLSVDWGAITISGNLSSITPLLNEEGYRVASDDGSLYLLLDDDGDGVFDASETGQTDATSGDVNIAVRDGKLPSLQFLADAVLGPAKQINDASGQIISLLTGDCYSIGYGAWGTPQTPVVVGAVYVVPQGETGGGDKLWRYDNGSWTGIALPQTGWTWENVVASPTDSQNLLLFGHAGTFYSFDGSGSLNLVADGTSASPMYYSNDGGATWSEVTLTGTNLNNGGDPVEIYGNTYVDFSTSGESAYITTVARNAVGLAGLQKLAYWAGDPSTGTLTGDHPGTPNWADNRDSYHTAVGPGDDEFYWTVRSGPQFALHYDSGSVANLGSIAGTIKPFDVGEIANAEILPGTSTAVMAGYNLSSASNLWITSDYTATLPTVVSGSSYSVASGYNSIVAAMADGTIFVSGGANLYEVTALSPYAQSTVESLTGENVGYVRSDRQSRTAAAARIASGTDLLVYNGAFWSRISGPPGVTTLANIVEVTT